VALGIGVIGYGYWGPNLARNPAEQPEARLEAVADAQEARLRLAARRYPGVAAHRDGLALIANRRVDAVAIATPVAAHYALAKAALDAGKHVLVEKPLAASAAEAEELVELAAKKRRVLMVDHTFVYNGAVKKIADLVGANALGEIYYYDSVRVNLGLFQSDVNVLWDLAVHDLSIMDYVLAAKPIAVSATGMGHLPGRPENVAFLTLYFDNPALIGHVHVNWLAPVKIRRTLIGASERMVVYDDLEPSEKVEVYDRGVAPQGAAAEMHAALTSYRLGDMLAPRLETAEPLAVEAGHFVDCVVNGTRPITDGEAGTRVVRVLEAASRSLTERGRPVEIGSTRPWLKRAVP
jgi:predicted dehydrogenase